MKWIFNILRILFIISLPAFFISLSLALAFNNLKLYEYSFDAYDVSQVTGIPRADLDSSARSLIRYFNSSDEFARIEVNQRGQETQLLTPDEQLHFRDVKALVWLDYKVLLGSFLTMMLFSTMAVLMRKRGYLRSLGRAALWGSGLALLVILAVVVGSFFDFQGLFLEFHYLAFNNNYWYAPGNMTLLFPEQFWYTAAMACIGFSALLALLTGIISLVLLKRKSR